MQEQSGYQPEEEVLAVPESIRNRANLKANIIDALKAKDSDRLIVAMQELRRYVLATSDMDSMRYGQDEVNKKDKHHITDGSWKRQFEEYFNNPHQTEVYFNGVTRLMIEHDGRLVISGVSSQAAKSQWRLVEDAYDFVYGE